MAKNRKQLFGIFAVIIVCILILGVCVSAALTQGFTNADPYGWLSKDKQAEQGENDGEDTANMFLASETYSRGMLLTLGEATTASDNVIASKTINATVDTANDSYKVVDWAVRFDNETSTWANGKNVTDFVQIVPTSDGSTTATINCYAPFGEKIIVVCSSRINPALEAECTLDYAKRVVDFTVSVSKQGTVVNAIDFGDAEPIYSISATPVWSVGTVAETAQGTVSVSLSSAFTSHLKNEIMTKGGLTVVNDPITNVTFNAKYSQSGNAFKFYFLDMTGIGFDNESNKQFGFFTAYFNQPLTMGASSRYYTAFVNSIQNACKAGINSYSGNIFDVTYSFTGTYSNYSATKHVPKGTVSYSSLSVSSVSLSTTSITF